MAHSSLKIIPFTNKDNLITAFKVKKTIITDTESSATASITNINQKSYIFADLENKFDSYQCLANEFVRISQSLKIHEGLYEFKLIYPVSLDMFSLFLVHANLKVFKLSKDITGKLINHIVVNSRHEYEFMDIDNNEAKLFRKYINIIINKSDHVHHVKEGENGENEEKEEKDGNNEEDENSGLDTSMNDAHTKGYSLTEDADGEVKLKIEYPPPSEQPHEETTTTPSQPPSQENVYVLSEKDNSEEYLSITPSSPAEILHSTFSPSTSNAQIEEKDEDEEPSPLTSFDMEVIGEILDFYVRELLTSQDSNPNSNTDSKPHEYYISGWSETIFDKDKPIESICDSEFSRYVKHVSSNRRAPQLLPTSEETAETTPTPTSTTEEDKI